ncbi:MAG: 1-deoxy-D-xylulose 5-phosphate reductoisomerase [Frankiales bacterium]|nr:1-deoxy-D-xylulose 5-phosphate reductoisomerase [Frankiales bacterium]
MCALPRRGHPLRDDGAVIDDAAFAPRPIRPEPTGAPSRPRDVILLGSTGSIGTQAVQVAEAAPDRFRIVGLSAAGTDPAALVEQALRTGSPLVAVTSPAAATEVRALIDARWPPAREKPIVVDGPGATEELATADCDVVLNGVAGAQGLRATLAALTAGRVVALANKESLIAGGPLVLAAAAPGQLVPVDSEHSALAQALRSGSAAEVRRLVLTASGGPFRGRSRSELAEVTPEQALAHPTWTMGPLVTTNSATLVNKGLELIEAALLFDVGYDRIDVVVHPQSIVHSMVEFVDGSTLAQASPPDMRLPIALALGWPDRVDGAALALDWTSAQTWTFQPVDDDAFPAVGVARRAGRAGGCAPAVFNAANETMVAAFHSGRCSFLAIVDVVQDVLERWLDTEHRAAGNPRDVADVEAAEDWARVQASALLIG